MEALAFTGNESKNEIKLLLEKIEMLEFEKGETEAR